VGCCEAELAPQRRAIAMKSTAFDRLRRSEMLGMRGFDACLEPFLASLDVSRALLPRLAHRYHDPVA